MFWWNIVSFDVPVEISRVFMFWSKYCEFSCVSWYIVSFDVLGEIMWVLMFWLKYREFWCFGWHIASFDVLVKILRCLMCCSKYYKFWCFCWNIGNSTVDSVAMLSENEKHHSEARAHLPVSGEFQWTLGDCNRRRPTAVCLLHSIDNLWVQDVRYIETATYTACMMHNYQVETSYNWGLWMRSVTWNRFPVSKKIADRFITWIQTCASLDFCRHESREASLLIPRKLAANQDFSITQLNCSYFASHVVEFLQ